MRYGFYLPTRGPTATRDGILALAREGERLGLHSAMIADHIVLPVESQSTYPYRLDGRHPSAGDALETFSILGVVAGATERLRLVTSVSVLPYRNPVLTAKMAASLDVLSGWWSATSWVFHDAIQVATSEATSFIRLANLERPGSVLPILSVP
jgi:alkanesulfonate monooxygenase SsuD/methylene tetrahydromethanopterin reductase-like flavin-dependent oxidoreductase (luciferase family)